MKPRRADWMERMWLVLESSHSLEFEYGRHDCVRLVARVLEAMTDEDWMPLLDTMYTNQRKAMRLIMRQGGLGDLASERLGTAVPPKLARRGDVVLLSVDTGPALGICVGERIAFAGPKGVAYLPIARAECAWLVN